LRGNKVLITVLAPQDQEPTCTIEILDQDTLDSLKADLISINLSWKDKLFEKIPGFCKVLLPHLDKLSKDCKLLYIVPDSIFSFIPFAALYFDDNTFLVDRCALVYSPSLSVLKSFISPAQNNIQSKKINNSLVFGVGKDSETTPKFYFDKQAEEIAKLLPNPLILLDDEASVDNFLSNIKAFDLVHLSCHGILDSSTKNPVENLAASRLELAHKCYLTARNIFDLKGKVHSDLVFLNACSSGTFKLSLGSEIGGFLEAFLLAGAKSVIATLYPVDPGAAQKVSMYFYSEWLEKGFSKPEALQRAQLAVRKEHPDPKFWASHILVGGYL